MAVNLGDIRDNFRKAYQNGSVYVGKYAPGNRHWLCYGDNLLEVKLADGDWLHIHKLFDSSGSGMNDDIVKEKAFPFVYDTKSITNTVTRCNRLSEHLKNIFPDHYVSVFVYNDYFTYSGFCKGLAYFTNGYGSSVAVILN